MIDYKGHEQSAGLAEALASQGIGVSVVDGVLWCSDPVSAQAIIDGWDEVVYQRSLIQPVTRRQMLTALHRLGMLETIKGSVAASGDVELQIAFDESQEFQRGNPFLATMAAALGKTPVEIDDVFALAATL